MSDINGKLFQSGWSAITQADIAAFLGKTLTSPEQTLVTALIASIEKTIARQCQRNFGNSSFYEILDAGQDHYYFFNFPVKEVTKIELDNVAIYTKGGGSNTYNLGVDFFVYPDKLVFNTFVPTSSISDIQALKITYTIEDVVGEDLKLAIKQWVGDIFLSREYAGKQVNSIGANGVSLQFEPTSIPNYIKMVITNYRKVLV